MRTLFLLLRHSLSAVRGFGQDEGGSRGVADRIGSIGMAHGLGFICWRA
jgi:hypothetical protein